MRDRIHRKHGGSISDIRIYKDTASKDSELTDMLKTLKQCQVIGSEKNPDFKPDAKSNELANRYPMVEFYYDYTPLDKGCPLLKNASASLAAESAADGAGANMPVALGGTQVPSRAAISKPNAAKETLYNN